MLSGFFGGILGLFAAVPVTFGIATVMYQLCQNSGDENCGLVFLAVLIYYSPWIALVTTIIGIVLTVKINNAREMRRPPPPSQPSDLEPPNRYD